MLSLTTIDFISITASYLRWTLGKHTVNWYIIPWRTTPYRLRTATKASRLDRRDNFRAECLAYPLNRKK